MIGVKRVSIATLCGFLFGLVCMGLASSNPESSETLSQMDYNSFHFL